VSADAWLQLVLAATIPIAVLAVVATRIWTGAKIQDGKGGRGLGVRAIQFLAVATTVPLLGLLAIRGLLQGEAVAAILGGLIGYLLSNIAKFDE
jgi:hypothetical protein